MLRRKSTLIACLIVATLAGAAVNAYLLIRGGYIISLVALVLCLVSAAWQATMFASTVRSEREMERWRNAA